MPPRYHGLKYYLFPDIEIASRYHGMKYDLFPDIEIASRYHGMKYFTKKKKKMMNVLNQLPYISTWTFIFSRTRSEDNKTILSVK